MATTTNDNFYYENPHDGIRRRIAEQRTSIVLRPNVIRQHHSKQLKRQWINIIQKRYYVVVVAIAVAVAVVIMLLWFSTKGSFRYNNRLRHRSNTYNFTTTFRSTSSSNKHIKLPWKELVYNKKSLDFGGLEIESLKYPFRRTIHLNEFARLERFRSQQLNATTTTTTNDLNIPINYWYYEDMETMHRSCRPPAWSKLQFLNCNTFHEVRFNYNNDDNQENEIYIINQGFYRDVWVNRLLADGTVTVLKTTKYKFEFSWRNIMDVHREALIMERLTAHDNIVTAYGHCGTSVITEAIPYQVEPYVVPGTGYLKQTKNQLHDRHDDVQPKNSMTAREKLDTALAMAESIAILHGFEEGTIVHNDVQLQQWLRTYNDTLKLGDFNRAVILNWNVKEHRYCKYSSGTAFGNYRAPEEINMGDLDEKIDVYSFANNIFCLLTGLWPFYENEDDTVVQDMVSSGKRPFVDPRYRNRSQEERWLVRLMERGWEQNATARVDIFDMVRLLRQASSELEQKKLQ